MNFPQSIRQGDEGRCDQNGVLGSERVYALASKARARGSGVGNTVRSVATPANSVMDSIASRQGLKHVHFYAQLERFVWDRGFA